MCPCLLKALLFLNENRRFCDKAMESCKEVENEEEVELDLD